MAARPDLSVWSRPIGDLPYRWGNFNVIVCAALALWDFGLAVVMPAGHDLIGVVFCVLILLFSGILAAATGLYKRRRYGVVFFLAPQFLLLLGAVLLGIASHLSEWPQDAGFYTLEIMGLYSGLFYSSTSVTSESGGALWRRRQLTGPEDARRRSPILGGN